MYTTYREKLEKHHKIILMLSIHVIHDILFIVWLLKVVYVALNMLFYYVTADNLMQYTYHIICIFIRWFRIFQTWRYQGIVKATVFWVVEDLKFKISESSDLNRCFPDSVQLAVSVKLRQLTGQSQENTNFGRSFLKF